MATADGAVCVGNGRSRAVFGAKWQIADSASCESGLVTDGPICATGCSLSVILFV